MSAKITAAPKGKATPKAKVLANGKGKGGTNIPTLLAGLTRIGHNASQARDAIIVRELELKVLTRKDVIAATGMDAGNLSALVKRFHALPAKGAARRNIMALDVSLIDPASPVTFEVAATAGKALAKTGQKTRKNVPNKKTGEEPEKVEKVAPVNPLAVTDNYTATAKQTTKDAETVAALTAWVAVAFSVRYPLVVKALADLEAKVAADAAQADAA